MKDASLKAQPSLYGVVIDKKSLQPREQGQQEGQTGRKGAGSTKSTHSSPKEAAALKAVLVDELWTILKDKTTQGIKDYLGAELYGKGAKFSRKMLEEIDYLNLNTDKWVGDERIDRLVGQTINNYIIKYKENRCPRETREVQPHQRRRACRQASSSSPRFTSPRNAS